VLEDIVFKKEAADQIGFIANGDEE